MELTTSFVFAAIPEDGMPEQEPQEDNPDERLNRELI